MATFPFHVTGLSKISRFREPRRKKLPFVNGVSEVVSWGRLQPSRSLVRTSDLHRSRRSSIRYAPEIRKSCIPRGLCHYSPVNPCRNDAIWALNNGSLLPGPQPRGKRASFYLCLYLLTFILIHLERGRNSFLRYHHPGKIMGCLHWTGSISRFPSFLPVVTGIGLFVGGGSGHGCCGLHDLWRRVRNEQPKGLISCQPSRGELFNLLRGSITP